MEMNNDIAREFLIESREAMERFDTDLLALEKNPSDSSFLSNIFRSLHTLKGSCGFLGFAKMEWLTHKGENLLSNIRDGKIAPGKQVVTCLFKLGDSIREILKCIAETQTEGNLEFTALLGEMESFQSDWVGKKDESKPMFVEAAGAESVSPAQASMEQVETKAQSQEPPAQRDSSTLSDQTIRVDVALLDKLMNLVGELVLVRNQVLRHTHMTGNTQLTVPSQHLNLITTELQEGVMKTRMQPIKNVWSKFPRIVRELSESCGKLVQVEMEGEDTELDKTILEAIKDPLTHVIRNSVDHGIETPEARVALGKPEEGRIFLKAYHKGGQVNIEISDDGAGIDCQRVARKALEKGLITAEKMAKMQEWELAQLIFLPGFSTAEKITNVSGRGVGMDVVKTHVEKIGGTIDLLNRPGQGLTLKVKIPLTLAIIPALIVETTLQRFAIPQINILEVVRLKDVTPDKGVEWIQESPVFRLRGTLLPLVRLERLFAKASGVALTEPSPVGENFIVVLQADNINFGILVHAVQDTQEIVVKPLSTYLKTASLFAGATIMGDGKVALILDVPGLAQNANLTREAEEIRALGRSSEKTEDGKLRESMLIVSVDSYGLIAVPLANLSRLQDLLPSDIEKMANTEVIQSRGKLMPIIRLGNFLQGYVPGEALHSTLPKASDSLNVVVFTEGSQSAGFVVDRILDIVEAAMDIQLPASRPGFRGSAIIKGKATEVLDLPAFARLALPTLFDVQIPSLES